MSQIIQDRWDRLLTNWALWKAQSTRNGGGGPLRDWDDCPPRPPQPLVGQALDTDDLLVTMQTGDQLDRNRYDAVVAWYTWAGNKGDWAISLGINRDTLSDRVKSARYRLDDLDILRRRRATRPPRTLPSTSNTPMHGAEIYD